MLKFGDRPAKREPVDNTTDSRLMTSGSAGREGEPTFEEKPKRFQRFSKELIMAHVKAYQECRWCFAVDGYIVEGEIVGRQIFPDAALLRLKCPRCGGEFTQYIDGWEDDYVAKILSKLHPEWKKSIIEEQLSKISPYVFPENLIYFYADELPDVT